MLDSGFRPLLERFNRPLVGLLPARVGPTAISIAGFVLGIGCALLLVQGENGAALALFALNRLLDGLDGSVARATGRQTDFGGYLDIFLDFVVYAMIPIAVAVGRAASTGGEAYLPVAILLASFYVNAVSWLYLSAILEKRATQASRPGTTSIVMPTGLIEGTETIILFTLIILLPAYAPLLMWTMAALVGVTAFQRLLWARRTII